MKKNIEIPYEQDRHGWYRFFEMLPAILSWSLLALPLVLSLVNVTLAAVFILFYILIYFTRSIAVDIRALGGYKTMREHAKVDWNELIAEVEQGEVADPAAKRPK